MVHPFLKKILDQPLPVIVCSFVLSFPLKVLTRCSFVRSVVTSSIPSFPPFSFLRFFVHSLFLLSSYFFSPLFPFFFPSYYSPTPGHPPTFLTAYLNYLYLSLVLIFSEAGHSTITMIRPESSFRILNSLFNYLSDEAVLGRHVVGDEGKLFAYNSIKWVT